MDLWDFPALSAAESPEEAVPEIEKLRQPDRSWMQEKPLACRLEDWNIAPSRRRYTVSVEDVPFECLYFSGESKKLYVVLSAGGVLPSRRYPSFFRWTYRNYFTGHMLCIDDPMYFFHPETIGVMWYYGTKEVSYLALLAKIVRKAMEQLGIRAEDVVYFGMSGGGYAALYLCNMTDYSSAIAENPQFILKEWHPVIYDNFLKWGIDLDGDDPFRRNRLCLDNKTCTFFIWLNYNSKRDYETHFRPFAEAHGIPIRYGLSQSGNFITWIHAPKYPSPHAAFSGKIEDFFMFYLLQKARQGANLNELRPASLAANEILSEKFDYRAKAEEASRELQSYRKRFFPLISQMLPEECGKFVNSPAYSAVSGNQNVELIPEIHDSYVNFYVNARRDVYYQVLYIVGEIRLRFCRLLSSFGDKREDWLKQFKRITEKSDGKLSWRADNERAIIGKVLESDNQRGSIRYFVSRTAELWSDELPPA